jgi:hypothetical protein
VTDFSWSDGVKAHCFVHGERQFMALNRRPRHG